MKVSPSECFASNGFKSEREADKCNVFIYTKKKKPCRTIEYNHTQPKYFDWLLKRHIAWIKKALVIDWLNLFSQQLATVSASLNKRNLDLSSWDSFFCPLSTMHRVNFYSLIYLSEQAPTKVLGNLTCISITPEWLSRDKSWHTMQKHRYCSCPLFLNSFFFLSPFLSSFLLPLPKTKHKSTSKYSFHFKRFWTISQVTSNLSEVLVFCLKFQESQKNFFSPFNEAVTKRFLKKIVFFNAIESV